VLRRKLLLVLVGLALVLEAWYLAVRPPLYLVGHSDYDKIQAGMNRQQVEDILGPAGDYRTGATLLDMHVTYELQPGLTGAGWISDHWVWIIGFDADGRVRQKRLWDNPSVPQGRVENLIWRTKRLFRRWFPE
jgi:hypothetical protein